VLIIVKLAYKNNNTMLANLLRDTATLCAIFAINQPARVSLCTPERASAILKALI
jgi:hypothetical protein